jgi:hypothetical protein
MNSSGGPERWSDLLLRAVVTVVLAAAGVYIAWQLLKPLLPALFILGGLLIVFRIALGGVRRFRGW